MHKTFLVLGSLLAALSVALGAFGAHGLKKIATAETVSTFQTGVQYQMYHALALLAVAIIHDKLPYNQVKWAGWCFLIGIILFSGSLYFLTWIKATEKVGLEGAGIITPFGGLFFIAGWIFLLFTAITKVN
jgi:uncharacterized membrane protein YgdD (TMEM256/DUF423 family)